MRYSSSYSSRRQAHVASETTELIRRISRGRRGEEGKRARLNLNDVLNGSLQMPLAGSRRQACQEGGRQLPVGSLMNDHLNYAKAAKAAKAEAGSIR